jgi:hypothetical protein
MTLTPDFFIVGAPKCGTTALYAYLSDRADIFMPSVKEPNFFASDLNVRRQVPNETTYKKLFSGARPDQLCGEASVWYLLSTVACRDILQTRPDARLIAMIRNPIDMALSWHAQLVYSLWEEEKDFKKSWDLQERRAASLCTYPRIVDEPRLFQYREICALGTQLERFCSTVPESQRLILMFDDLHSNAQSVYERVLNFLNLPQDGRTDFPKINERKSHHYNGFANTLRSMSNGMSPVKNYLRKFFPNIPSSILKPLYDLQSAAEDRPKPSPEMMEILIKDFTPEITKLENILQRDLRHWTHPRIRTAA